MSNQALQCTDRKSDLISVFRAKRRSFCLLKSHRSLAGPLPSPPCTMARKVKPPRNLQRSHHSTQKVARSPNLPSPAPEVEEIGEIRRKIEEQCCRNKRAQSAPLEVQSERRKVGTVSSIATIATSILLNGGRKREGEGGGGAVAREGKEEERKGEKGKERKLGF
ncbi:hypothetical protein JCGZ_10966 [Jatropha curcas]|uniref:Uncharacterized protein n=1 Tax=Jatropha curcas TaxID=180498 RepID=A0A067LE13_JATCU|nr:hypothetical protein JCGZ_10966 [Jatropha curcas]